MTERLAYDYRPKTRAAAEAYVEWCREVFEPEEFEEIKARLRLSEKRQRKPSVTALIKRARKAGERGPVRVELPGGTVLISSEHEQTTTTTGNELDQWMAKRAH